MKEQPVLKTARLVLRPFKELDGPEIERLAGDVRVAETTLNIPHPYPPHSAALWVKTHKPLWVEKRGAVYGIFKKQEDVLLGAISLSVTPDRKCAVLGYWIGYPFWGQGLATEAGKAILDFGFSELAIDKVESEYLLRNGASGRVMEKLGMSLELKFSGPGRISDVPEARARLGVNIAIWQELRNECDK